MFVCVSVSVSECVCVRERAREEYLCKCFLHIALRGRLTFWKSAAIAQPTHRLEVADAIYLISPRPYRNEDNCRLTIQVHSQGLWRRGSVCALHCSCLLGAFSPG